MNAKAIFFVVQNVESTYFNEVDFFVNN